MHAAHLRYGICDVNDSVHVSCFPVTYGSSSSCSLPHSDMLNNNPLQNFQQPHNYYAHVLQFVAIAHGSFFFLLPLCTSAPCLAKSLMHSHMLVVIRAQVYNNRITIIFACIFILKLLNIPSTTGELEISEKDTSQ